MSDRTIYPQKILTDQDLSQNDILNVRKINNDDYNVLIDSKNHVQIESVEPGSTNDAFVKVSPRTVDAETTGVVTIDDVESNHSSKVVLTPGKINADSSNLITVKAPKLDIDASTKVTVDTPEVINTVGSHYKTSVGDKSIEIKESGDSFILQHGNSADSAASLNKIEINNGSIKETTPVANFESSTSINLDTPDFNIKDTLSDSNNPVNLINIRKKNDIHIAEVNFPLEESEVSVSINGPIVVTSESNDYEGNQATYTLKDLIEKGDRTTSGNFQISTQSASINSSDEAAKHYNAKPANTLSICSESDSSPGVRVNASETRIISTDSQLMGNSYSPNVLSVNNNDITLYTDESNGYIKLEQSIENNAYKNSIEIKADDVDINSPGDIALESDTSAKIKSGDNYMEVTPSTGTIHIDNGTLGIDAEESITSVSGKTQIKQTSDVGGIADSDKIEISVEKEDTFNSSILLDKDKILEDSKNITLDSDTRTEVKSDNTVYLSSENGGNSTYNSNGVATTGNVISNTAGNSSETITSSGLNAGISRVSDSKDCSKVELGNDISEIEVLPDKETFTVTDGTDTSSIVEDSTSIILTSKLSNMSSLDSSGDVNGSIKIETFEDDNIEKSKSTVFSDEVIIESEGSNIINLSDDGGSIDIPTGVLSLSSDEKISSTVSGLEVSLEKNNQEELIKIVASDNEDTSIISLNKDSITSQSKEIISSSNTLTESKSNTESVIGVIKNGNYSSSSRYTDGVINNSATTISDSANNINITAVNTIDIIGSSTNEIKVGNLDSNTEGIHLISKNTISSESSDVEIKITDFEDHKASVKLSTDSSSKEVNILATDGVSIEAPAAGNSSTNSNITLEAAKNISTSAEKTIISGPLNSELEITTTTSSIKSTNINIGKEGGSNISLEGSNNLVINSVSPVSTSFEGSYVSADNLHFNKTLSSNEIKIYWDDINHALVFGRA